MCHQLIKLGEQGQFIRVRCRSAIGLSFDVTNAGPPLCSQGCRSIEIIIVMWPFISQPASLSLILFPMLITQRRRKVEKGTSLIVSFHLSTYEHYLFKLFSGLFWPQKSVKMMFNATYVLWRLVSLFNSLGLPSLLAEDALSQAGFPSEALIQICQIWLRGTSLNSYWLVLLWKSMPINCHDSNNPMIRLHFRHMTGKSFLIIRDHIRRLKCPTMLCFKYWLILTSARRLNCDYSAVIMCNFLYLFYLL